MVVWRPECVLLHEPARWENDKVKSRLAWVICLCGQYCEDRWIWVVERDRSDSAELVQVVFEGVIIAVPRNNVEGTTILLIFKNSTQSI